MLSDLLFLDYQRYVAGSLHNLECSTLSSGLNSLEGGAGAYKALCHVKVRGIHAEVLLSILVLCVCNGTLQKLHKIFGRALGGILKNCHSGIRILTSDEVQNNFNLARGDSDILQVRSAFGRVLLSSFSLFERNSFFFLHY